MTRERALRGWHGQERYHIDVATMGTFMSMRSSLLPFDRRSPFRYFAAVTEESLSPEVSTTDDAPREDVGPDPVWGLGIGAFGLLNMALGGAFTWHYWFNVGEGFMLLGAVIFIGSAVVTRLKQTGFSSLSGPLRRVFAAIRRH